MKFNINFKRFRLKLIKKLNNIVEDNLFCSNNIIYKKSEKKDIYKKYQAGLIDMESEGVQKVCIKYKIPFVALKIILDDSETSLPEDLVNFYFKDEKLKYLYKFPLYLFAIIELGLSFLKARVL